MEISECTRVLCDKEPVGIVSVLVKLRTKNFTYHYPYCEDDLPYFSEKFSDKSSYEVEVTMLPVFEDDENGRD